MSIVITTDVFCDGPDCSQWTNGATGPRTLTDTARANALRQGWVKRYGFDYCPKCAEVDPGEMRARRRQAMEASRA